MSVPPDVRQALDSVRAMLAVDGYELELDYVDGSLEVAIVAGPESCADCLVPKTVMHAQIETALGANDDVDALVLRLRYPTDGQ